MHIEGKFLGTNNAQITNQISFIDNYADVSALGNRIENLAVYDINGAQIGVKKLPRGEFLAEKTPAAFAYDVMLETAENSTAAAHVSWFKSEQGLLMLNDLLPEQRSKTSGKIIFETPDDWQITSSEKKIGNNTYAVENVEKAIFLIGKNWREKSFKVAETDLDLAISGAWQFSDQEALEMAASITNEYRKLFGEIPVERAQIFVLPLTGTENSSRWRAETRGQTVTLVSGAIQSKREALQRLHEQLRHEIFHFWIPNAVDLSGNYDWFYEGFTVYEALKTGVWLNQIRFEDYLNTLGQAFDLAKNQPLSLVEMSRGRWAGTNNSVYAKGMCVAFLCDVALLNQSRGKRSIAEIFQKIYRKYHRAGAETDATTAVIQILNSYPELQPLIKKYITGNEKIVFSDDVKTAGLENSGDSEAMRLRVSAQPDKRQKDLLDKLGYNRWRELLK